MNTVRTENPSLVQGFDEVGLHNPFAYSDPSSTVNHCCHQHTIIPQQYSRGRLGDTDDEGLHAPLLLDFLDLSAWTSLFVLAIMDAGKTVSTLKIVQSKLADLLIEDEDNVDKATLLV